MPKLELARKASAAFENVALVQEWQVPYSRSTDNVDSHALYSVA